MEKIKPKLEDLIKRYENIKASGKIKHYNEANTRKDFLLPLFSLLGWDVYNQEEVKEEETASKGRVDYCFKLKGIPKFFLEAKALKINIDEPRWAEQAINYAWHKGVSWAVLSDFEGIRIYNAEWKTTRITDNLFISLNYNEYLSGFDQLWLLSKEGFAENLLNREAEKWGKKTKKTPVQDIVFQDLMHWRTILSKGINKYPGINNLSEEEIDECVQRILDRLIFIRTCEDREIEKIHLLSGLREYTTQKRGRSLFDVIVKIFRDFDDGYNSNLFQKHLCEDLKIDDEVLEEIINGLYQTKDGTIRYDFSSIPADVLGGIYEQYLGHILKKTEKRAKIKKEHQKRKEQGIYYTPTYIVDYIVKNTVGELLKTLPYSKARNIKILDPACGSGSFLIKAFEVMDEYLKKERKSKQEFDYFRRTEVITKNIYGVDLDPQAVEIARLNLLLKTLQTRAKLPDLAKNIKCGNSLISGNELDLFKYFGDDYQKKRPFDWHKEFSEVFKDGGFDVVVGNPPYVSAPNMVSAMPEERKFIIESHNYKYLFKKWDIFLAFIERALKLLKDNGFLSFIVPNNFLTQDYGEKVRKYILENTKILNIADLTSFKVFKDATVFPIIFVLRKNMPKYNHFVIVEKYNENFVLGKNYKIKQKEFLSQRNYAINIGLDEKVLNVLYIIDSSSIPLSDICYLSMGAEIDIKEKTGTWSKKLAFSNNSNDEKFLEAKDIERYKINFKNRFIKYEPSIMRGPRFRELFTNRKILVRDITGKQGLICCIDENNHFVDDNLKVIIPKHLLKNIKGFSADEELLSKKYNLYFLLALLNSKLINFYFISKLGTDLHVYVDRLKFIPIHKIDFSNPDDVKIHNDLVALVDKMLSLNKHLATLGGKLTDERTHLEKEIQRTDREIDELVYKVYGLTEEEIKIIEGVKIR